MVQEYGNYPIWKKMIGSHAGHCHLRDYCIAMCMGLWNYASWLFLFPVLKLLKMAKGIRALLDTVMQALPQVGNLGLLFFLLFFIFAALGVELFGRLGELVIFLVSDPPLSPVRHSCIHCGGSCDLTISIITI